MSLLNNIIGYWLDCIKNEDVLAKDISINVRTRAVLYPFSYDPFIFHRNAREVDIDDKSVLNFLSRSQTKNEEVFYGYPLLFYFDDKKEKYRVAPFFVVKLGYKSNKKGSSIYKDESIPNCGIQALHKIGLKTEEIANLNRDFEDLFKSDISDSQLLAKKCIDLLLEETNFSINEEIDPKALSSNRKLRKNSQIGLYNKSIIFSGESTLFNMSLIKDLIKLKNKNDIDQTALSFIENGNLPNKDSYENSLVLPFPLNNYQISALNHVLKNRLSVITGPPGTGKSQFIMDLLINLFLNNKTVLFVSHTNEAVDVVNEKINEDFKNILLRTGNKELRQGLLEKFNELSFDSQRNRSVQISIKRISYLWNRIFSLKKRLLQIDEIEQKVNELLDLQKLNKSLITFIKLKFLIWRLYNLPSKIEIEDEIKQSQVDLFHLSKEYVRSTYTKKILGKWGASNKAKDFIHDVINTRFHEDIPEYSFTKALSILKLWSSTLKSLNRTFPLKAGIFDYVIFDEASQIDLPSAAPALYRAKNAVIVGDPMQLSHIAGITRDLDKEIAESHDLIIRKKLYPSKIRYYDVSLYRCADSISDTPPILLAKHYRSDDQIINLCNKVFYNGQLTIASNLNYSKWPSGLPLGIQWENCNGTSIKPLNGSRINKEEALKVNDVFQNILDHIKDKNLTVGIVTPYSQQQKLIHQFITDETDLEVLEKHQVKILTAHKFQGSEKDIMIFSVVLSSKGNGNSDRWYNSNPQILNVALSRAKYLLYIVGEKQFCLQRKGVLKKIAENYDQIKKEEKFEEHYFAGNFETKEEELLYQKLQKQDFESLGFKLIPKYVEKRYTLDFALINKDKKIDIECDGFGTHNIIDGLPVIEDVERDDYLYNKEWTVLRFPNYEIRTKPDVVVNEILEECRNGVE